MADPREEISFQSYINEMGNLQDRNPLYRNFVEAVKNAEQKIRQLHTPDINGAIPVMTEADRSELMRLHFEIGRTAEAVLKGEQDQELRDKVDKIASLASGNYSKFASYDPNAEQKTLPTLLEDVRTMRIDLRDSKLAGKVGGAVSSRQPLTFKNEKNQTVGGVFTEKKTSSYWDDFCREMEVISENIKDPVQRAKFAQWPKIYKEKHRDKWPENDSEGLYNLLMDM